MAKATPFPTPAQLDLLEVLEDAYGHDAVLQAILTRQGRPNAMYAGGGLHLAEVFDCLTEHEAAETLRHLCTRFGYRSPADDTDDRERDERELEGR